MYTQNLRCKFLSRNYSRRLFSEKNAVKVSDSASSEVASASNVEDAVDLEAEKEKNLKYEKIADISRMKTWHRKLFHKQITPPNEFKWQQERSALKERYAKYGKASGVDPGVLWMSEVELKEKIAEEQEWSPKLFETVQLMKNQKLEEKQIKSAKLQKLEANLAKYPKEYEEYRSKLIGEQITKDDYSAKKKLQIQEVQDYFGYAIETNDPRFVAMLQKKQMEEKKAAKIAWKKAKETRMMERLQTLTAAGSEQAAKEEKKEESQT